MKRTLLGLAAASALALAATAAGAPAASADVIGVPAQFGGSGTGPTADVALDAALAQARADAAVNGFTDCSILGDPIITASANPGQRTIFHALVVLGCLK